MFFFARFFFCFFLALCTIGHAQSQRSKEAMIKEVRALNQEVKKVQTRLSSLMKSMDHTKVPAAQGLAHPERINHWILNKIGGLSLFLKERLTEFIYGVRISSQTLWRISLCTHSLQSNLSALGIGLIISALVLWSGRLIFRKRRQYQKRHHHRYTIFHQIVLVSAMLFLPMVPCLGISWLTGLLFQHFNLSIAYAAGYINVYSLLPCVLYGLWASWTWMQVLYSPARPSHGLLPLDPYGAHRVAIYFRRALIGAASLNIFFLIAEMCALDPTVKRTIVDTAVLIIGWSLVQALKQTRHHLLSIPEKISLESAIQLLRYGITIICSIWLIGFTWILNWMPLLGSTMMMLLALAPLKDGLERFRIRVLWVSRHKKFVLRPLFHTENLLNHILQSTVYGSICVLWALYFWSEDPGLNLVLEEFFFYLITSPLVLNVFNSLLIVLGALCMVKGGRHLLRYYVEEKYSAESMENNFLAGRLKTLMAILRTVWSIVVWIPAVSLIFAQFGELNITAWITSIGAASFGLTFGFQSIVRDFVTGFFIILENNLMVGDEVEIESKTGKVEAITIRTLKIRTDNGMLLTIPFGSITIIGNKNRHFSAILSNISIGYGEDLEKIQTLVEKAFSALRKIPGMSRRIIGSLEIRGVQEVTSYSVVLQIKITTAPNAQDMVRRAFNKQLKRFFDEAGIKVPVPPCYTYRAMPSLTNTII